MKFNTQLLHGNAIKRYPDGATLPPISQVSAFAYETAQDLEKVFNNRAPDMLIQESVIRLSIPLKEGSVNWKAEKERLPVPPGCQP